MESATNRVKLVSYKLRFHDHHVRMTISHDAHGLPYRGPGLDLRGEPAVEAFALAHHAHKWLLIFEPDTLLRALSMDLTISRAIVSYVRKSQPERVCATRLQNHPMVDQLNQQSEHLHSYLRDQAASLLVRRANRAAESASVQPDQLKLGWFLRLG
jgi:hypothetical protein